MYSEPSQPIPPNEAAASSSLSLATHSSCSRSLQPLSPPKTQTHTHRGECAGQEGCCRRQLITVDAITGVVASRAARGSDRAERGKQGKGPRRRGREGEGLGAAAVSVFPDGAVAHEPEKLVPVEPLPPPQGFCRRHLCHRRRAQREREHDRGSHCRLSPSRVSAASPPYRFRSWLLLMKSLPPSLLLGLSSSSPASERKSRWRSTSVSLARREKSSWVG
ncbi:uncharacterized protein LOC110269188 [Arachis ipaensis]|uniref:uncharacterized protein LOC110269188 n=1 Tax=Arachis ipaensis TaxID=130454 RepID=UPI000A2AF262|nr:uncharacterized protein LOC110269188 [Arachis ipaensis]